MKEKFIFCWNWYKMYITNKESKYDAVLDTLFTGSKISSAFISNTVCYSNPERGWDVYSKNNTAKAIETFISKLHPIFSELK